MYPQNQYPQSQYPPSAAMYPQSQYLPSAATMPSTVQYLYEAMRGTYPPAESAFVPLLAPRPDMSAPLLPLPTLPTLPPMPTPPLMLSTTSAPAITTPAITRVPRTQRPTRAAKPVKAAKPAIKISQAPQPLMPNTNKGPNTGESVMKLPVEDLKKPGAGAWQGKVNLKKSTVTTFQGEPVVKVFFKKGSGTGSMPHHESSGASCSCQNNAVKGQTGVVVAFDVFFERGAWDWSRGGKLGGLFVGPGVASGYRHSDDGASHRIMWQREGGAISYIYPPAKLPQADPKLKPDGHGIGYFGNLFKEGTLKVGAWNRVEIGVKVNTFTGGKPNPDGKSMLTVNGVTGSLDNVRWAKSPDLKIHAFEFSTFFGGPSPATVDSTLYVKNFEVFKWKD